MTHDESDPARCRYRGCTRSEETADTIARAAAGPSPHGDRCTQHLPRCAANVDRETIAFKSHDGTRFNCDPRVLRLISETQFGVYATLAMEGPRTLDDLAATVSPQDSYAVAVAVLVLVEKGLVERTGQPDQSPVLSAVTRSAQIADQLDAIGPGSYWEVEEPANPRSDDPSADPGPCHNWAIWDGNVRAGSGRLLAYRRFEQPVTGERAIEEMIGLPLTPYTLAQLSDERWERLLRDIAAGASTDLVPWLYAPQETKEASQ